VSEEAASTMARRFLPTRRLKRAPGPPGPPGLTRIGPPYNVEEMGTVAGSFVIATLMVELG
jgi:hypothetical protein